MNLGPLALQYLLDNGGSGYFRTRVVQRHLDKGSLKRVTGSPEFSYPIYLMYQPQPEMQTLEQVLLVLRKVLSENTGWS